MRITANPPPTALPGMQAPDQVAAAPPPGIAGTLDAKLANFWHGMLDTMEERTGVDAIEHDRARDSAYLASKGRALRAEIDRLPDGPHKAAALEKLDGFVEKNTARIEQDYRRAMTVETGGGVVRDPSAFLSKLHLKSLL